jgi:hypothetical protein
VAVLAQADAAAVRRELEAHPEGFALTARQAALTPSQRPAADPDHRSAGRDQPRRPRLLLVVDQFEELFTQCAEEGQRRAFITALHAAATARHGADQAPAALVVLGVRSDFEARCADYPQLADAVQDRYLVTSMTERQLRIAITEPAKKAGAKVDEDLVGVLLAEMRNGQPGTTGAGALPLLSHALDQAWRCRTQATVTLADYERAGGIAGAVAASAQRAYEHLTLAQQAAARQVFTRLAATSTEGADSADRATRAELTEGKSPAEAQDVETVLEAFAAERLLTLAASTVELSHEVLLTAWPLLRDTWLADTRADRIVYTRLHTTAAEWARHSRDPSYLYSGSLLAAATDTAARTATDPARHPPLSQTERDFLHASNGAHRRTVRRRQGFIALLMALVIGLASVAAFAFLARQDAVRQRNVAVSGQLISQSETLGDTDPVISKLESIAAWRIHPSADARYAMLAAATRSGIAVLTGHSGPVYSVAFSPDGKTLVVGRGHRPPDRPSPHRPDRFGFPGGVQPGRRDPGRQRRRRVVVVGRGHRPPDRSPSHRPHRPGLLGGVQPGRQDPGHRQHSCRVVVGRGHRPPDRASSHRPDQHQVLEPQPRVLQQRRVHRRLQRHRGQPHQRLPGLDRRTAHGDRPHWHRRNRHLHRRRAQITRQPGAPARGRAPQAPGPSGNIPDVISA